MTFDDAPEYNPLFDDDWLFESDSLCHKIFLTGLARKCPKCKIVDHYDIKGKEPIEVECLCGHRFTVQKYKKGERPR